MRGLRVVVPQKLRTRVLQELHSGHPGIVKMARSLVWWPGLDKELESLAKLCTPCQSQRKNPPKAPLATWPWPATLWERVHVDYLGPFLGKMILVAKRCSLKMARGPDHVFDNSSSTITALEDMFARNGLHKLFVSDNGPQFWAKEFQEFMARNRLQHMYTPPYHLASNGAAERFVQSVKQSLRASHRSGTPLQQALATFLLKYQTTPHSTTGVALCTLFCQ